MSYITYAFVIFLIAFATEAIVELVIKSQFFAPFRKLMFKLGPWITELFKCGYCFSVWASMGMILAVPVVVLPFSNWRGVNLLLTLLIVHRLSNVIHNVIDKWTDKYYDLRYVNTDKS